MISVWWCCIFWRCTKWARTTPTASTSRSIRTRTVSLWTALLSTRTTRCKDLLGVVVFLFIFCSIVFFFPEMGGYFLEKSELRSWPTPSRPRSTLRRSGTSRRSTRFCAPSRTSFWASWPWAPPSPCSSCCRGWTAARSSRCATRVWLSEIWLLLFCLSFVILGVLAYCRRAPGAALLSQVCTFLYFAYFILMPFYTRMERTKPVPERVTG